MNSAVPLSLAEIVSPDALATGIALADEAARLAYANPVFIEITGLASWRGYPLGLLSAELADAVARAREQVSALTLRGVELAGRRADAALSARGRHVLIELHARTALDGGFVPKLSQTLRGLAHEVKNPLAGLRGAAQLLQRRLADPEQIKLAELIITEADRLAALTDRLLQPAGKPHLAVINVHEVAERARALVAAEAAPELKLERDYDPSLPPLRGIGDHLLQLLLNLLRNALQAQAKKILVRTRAEHGAVLNGRAGMALRLDVVDDGAGVPQELRESLFLPLVSGRGGTGLGLALAQEIAQEHGGQLAFRSRPGHTVFTLLLPLEREGVVP